MTLYIIGLGLYDEQDITVRGFGLAKQCDEVFLENYTSKMICSIDRLSEVYGRRVRPAFRQKLENTDELIDLARTKKVALLIMGDPFSATTHIDLIMRARKKGVEVKVIHNASVLNAVGATGLQLYKFGRTTSIPFPDDNPDAEAYYDIVKANQSIDAHTLILLDLNPDDDRFMTVNDAIRNLQKIELKRNEKVFRGDTLCIGCARLGWTEQKIVFGKASDLLKEDFGAPPHCLIIPSKLHFAEEEFLQQFRR
ncbi:diphthine synthase [Candidatus Woesearchaeota archaeon]|nr:diphthine synthase [Candidatus Woesearchaeota archaeon]